MIIGALLALAAAQEPPGTGCETCHAVTTPQVVAQFRRSVHFFAGAGCAGCHGGDAKATEIQQAHAAEAGFRPGWGRAEVPSMCATCHADIQRMKFYRLDTNVHAEFLTSRHGEKLLKGDTNVATCTSCHHTHDILSSREPDSPTHRKNVPKTCGKCHSDAAMMASYGIPTDQEEHYDEGIHGSILHGRREGNAALVPTCADCHGVHGAAPPEIRRVDAVCGTCHFYEARYYSRGPHAAAAHATGTPICVTCHGNHRNTIPAEGLVRGKGNGSSCFSCHEERDDPGARFADDLHGQFEQGRKAIERLQAAIAREPDAEVRRVMGLELEKTRDAYAEARKVSHSLEPKEVAAHIQRTVATANGALSYGERIRRREGGFSRTVVVLIVGGIVAAMALTSLGLAWGLLKLRERRRRAAAAKEAP